MYECQQLVRFTEGGREGGRLCVCVCVCVCLHCSHNTCRNIPVVSEGVSLSMHCDNDYGTGWKINQHLQMARFAYSVRLVATRRIMAFCRV